MLAKNFRLSKQKEIKQVFDKGSKYFGKFFIIRFCPNLEDNCRFVIIVSNKISKKATVRNKLKRQIREIIRLNLDKFNLNYDIIITVLNNRLDKDYDELQDCLLQDLKKAKLI